MTSNWCKTARSADTALTTGIQFGRERISALDARRRALLHRVETKGSRRNAAPRPKWPPKRARADASALLTDERRCRPHQGTGRGNRPGQERCGRPGSCACPTCPMPVCPWARTTWKCAVGAHRVNDFERASGATWGTALGGGFENAPPALPAAVLWFSLQVGRTS